MDKDCVLNISPILYEFDNTNGWKIHPITVALKRECKIDTSTLMEGFTLHKGSTRYFIKPKELFTSKTELIIHPIYIETINN